jgi:hypothetical protein
MNKVSPLRYWKYWCGRLIVCYLIMLVGCVLTLPLAGLVIAPFTAWLTADVPYTWPTPEQLIKWVRYGLWCTVWVGTISWLSELIPWLSRMWRGQD